VTYEYEVFTYIAFIKLQLELYFEIIYFRWFFILWFLYTSKFADSKNKHPCTLPKSHISCHFNWWFSEVKFIYEIQRKQLVPHGIAMTLQEDIERHS